jgi:hypothetical protein
MFESEQLANSCAGVLSLAGDFEARIADLG